jgi:hypothetical protein
MIEPGEHLILILVYVLKIYMGFAVEHEQTSNNMITPRRDYCNPLSGIFGGIRLGVNANG